MNYWIARIIKLMDEPNYINHRVTVDGIVEYEGKLITIRRGIYPFKDQLAFPGGHVNLCEHPDDAVIREFEEETNLKTKIRRLIGVYCGEQRDPRGPSVAFVYELEVTGGELKAGDDAKAIELVPFEPIEDLAFDHSEILKDYLEVRNNDK